MAGNCWQFGGQYTQYNPTPLIQIGREPALTATSRVARETRAYLSASNGIC